MRINPEKVLFFIFIEVDSGEKEIDGEIKKGLVFKLKCTKCPYESEFAFLGLDLEEEGDEDDLC